MLKNIIKSIITYILWGLICFPIMCLCALFAFIPESWRYDNKIIFRMFSFFAKTIMRTTMLRIKITGQENLPNHPSCPAIVIANHSSAFDIPIVDMLFGSYPRMWMSKKSYIRIPIFGFLVKRMHIPIDKASLHGARQSLEIAHQRASQGARHIMIFPEGKRYDDGKIHKFYSGFAILTQKLGRPVIPIVIGGLHKVFPKGSFFIASSGQEIKINIGKPIHFDKTQTSAEITATMHSYFEEELKKLET